MLLKHTSLQLVQTSDAAIACLWDASKWTPLDLVELVQSVSGYRIRIMLQHCDLKSPSQNPKP